MTNTTITPTVALVETLVSDLGGPGAAATAIGVAPGTIWRWRNGTFTPSASKLAALAAASGKSLTGLLAATGSPVTKIAGDAGVNPGTIWRWGTGAQQPTPAKLHAVAAAAGLAPKVIATLVHATTGAAPATAPPIGFPEPVNRPDAPILGGYAAKMCHTIASKDADPNYTDDMRDPWSPFMESLFANGNAYEDEVGEAFAEAHDHIVVDCTDVTCPSDLDELLAAARTRTMVSLVGTRDKVSKVAREYATHALMDDPGSLQVIWNARLRSWRNMDDSGVAEWAGRVCEPDFIWFAGYDDNGNPTWGPGDVKWHKPFEGETKDLVWEISDLWSPHPASARHLEHDGRPHKADAFQLAHYWRALEWHGYAPAGSPIGGLIGKDLPNDGKVIVWVPLAREMYDRNKASALGMYDSKFATVTRVVVRARERGIDPSLPSLAPPEWKSDCGECQWKSSCHDELSESDHITLLAGVTPDRAQPLYAAGIGTIRDLANLDVPTARLVDAKAADLLEFHQAVVEGTWDDAEPARVAICEFWDHATDKKINDLVAAAAAAGYETVADLRRIDPVTAGRPPVGKGSLVAQIDQARVTDYARVRKQTHVFRDRGVEAVRLPRANVEVHVDMENDEHIYMWGCYLEERSGSTTVTGHHDFSDFSATDAGEADCFARFWKWLNDTAASARAKYGPNGFKAYYYTAAENRCLRHLAKAHAGMPGIPTLEEVETFIGSDDWVDLFPQLTKPLIWPTEKQSLKDLAKYSRFMWRDEDPSGSSSVVWYREAVGNDDEAVREQFRSRIRDYNEDDCRATAHLLNWVDRFNQVANPTAKLANVDTLDRRYGPARRV